VQVQIENYCGKTRNRVEYYLAWMKLLRLQQYFKVTFKILKMIAESEQCVINVQSYSWEIVDPEFRVKRWLVCKPFSIIFLYFELLPNQTLIFLSFFYLIPLDHNSRAQ
jgi:hypothetical protein